MQTLQALEVFDEFSPIEDMDAATARQLIDANRWYQLSNSGSLISERRVEARAKSSELLSSILHADPEQPDAINLQGRIALDCGDTSAARELIEQAIRLYPGKAAFWCNRGFVALVQQEYEQAESYFTQALVYDKASIQAFAAIALCYYLRGDFIGAFMRYRSLLQKGVINLAGTHAMLDCSSHLSADCYDENLAEDIITLFMADGLNHSLLSQLASSLVVKKYNLDNDDCVLEMDDLATDKLLLLLLQKGELCSTAIEELVVLMRQQILIEVAQTGALRDELQQLAINLGLFIERTDYVPFASQDEVSVVEDIDECVRGACNSSVSPDELTGALIVISMYKQLYTQNYSYHLLAFDASDWPEATQPLLTVNLYRKSDLHAIKFSLPQSDKDIDRSFNSPYLAAAYPRWEVLPYHTSSSYYQALSKELGKERVPSSWAARDIRVLVIGCRTGDRAIRLANYFEGANVTAVDVSADNIAYAIYQSKKHNVHNIGFRVLNSSTDLKNMNETFDVIEIGEELSADLEVILHSKSMLANDGFIRFETTQHKKHASEEVMNALEKRTYLPTAENVRQLRQQIAAMESATGEEAITKNKEFYSLTGCYQLLFHTYDNTKAAMHTIWDKTGLKALNAMNESGAVYVSVTRDKTIKSA